MAYEEGEEEEGGGGGEEKRLVDLRRLSLMASPQVKKKNFHHGSRKLGPELRLRLVQYQHLPNLVYLPSTELNEPLSQDKRNCGNATI